MIIRAQIWGIDKNKIFDIDGQNKVKTSC